MSANPAEELTTAVDELVDGAHEIQLLVDKAIAEMDLANASTKSEALVKKAERARELLADFQTKKDPSGGST